MSWITVALAAYFFLAIANVLDKFLVDKVLPGSRAYAFIACLAGAIVVLAAPWLLDWPGGYWLMINLFSGAIFALALWSLYESLRRGEASRTLVFIGGLTPVLTISFSVLFLGERYSLVEWLGIAALVAGIFVVAALPQKRSFLWRFLKFPAVRQGRALVFAMVSALAYAAYFLLSKYAYSAQEFASAFIWTRIGAALAVSLFLLFPASRNEIRQALKKKSPRPKNSWFLVLGNQALGSAGFILQNYAIFLGTVSLVNALQGVQYAFLLVISAVLAASRPKLLKEDFSWRSSLQKGAAVVLVGLGLYLLVL
jgi:drug/metabolite transporter (DMT)-like permease